MVSCLCWDHFAQLCEQDSRQELREMLILADTKAGI
jgi:hypothetical protein